MTTVIIIFIMLLIIGIELFYHPDPDKRTYESKQIKLGKGWRIDLIIFLDGKFRIGFRLSSNIISLQLIYVYIEICNLHTTPVYSLKKSK